MTWTLHHNPVEKPHEKHLAPVNSKAILESFIRRIGWNLSRKCLLKPWTSTSERNPIQSKGDAGPFSLYVRSHATGPLLVVDSLELPSQKTSISRTASATAPRQDQPVQVLSFLKHTIMFKSNSLPVYS